MLIDFEISDVDWEKGLIPAIVQDASSLQNLMLGYMDKAALEATLEKGLVTFFSRSKQRLWTKGETSGNHLQLVSAQLDCDKDSLLIKAHPVGPTCHTGTHTCWNEPEAPATAWLAHLEARLHERAQAEPESSYTARLMQKGTKRIAQKVGEEGVEVALAAMAQDKEELINESADLLFHLTVLLQDAGLSYQDVIACLQDRAK